MIPAARAETGPRSRICGTGGGAASARLSRVRICIVYDCLFPYTVGGAERWYRNLAERLVQDGHDVTYLTLRQWPRGQKLDLDERVRVVTAGPRMGLYTSSGRRRILPPLVFGAGVLWHLLRRGRRYDVGPHLLVSVFLTARGRARAPARALRARGRLVRGLEPVLLARLPRRRSEAVIGALVQRACALVPQRAYCFSELHAQRLREEGLRGPVRVLRGLYARARRAGGAAAGRPGGRVRRAPDPREAGAARGARRRPRRAAHRRPARRVPRRRARARRAARDDRARRAAGDRARAPASPTRRTLDARDAPRALRAPALAPRGLRDGRRRGGRARRRRASSSPARTTPPPS